MRLFFLLALLCAGACRHPDPPPANSQVHVNVPGAMVNVREDGGVNVRGGPVRVNVP